MQEWKEHGVFEITEQRLCDQARTIRKKGWLSDVEENQTERGIVRASEGNEQIGDDSDEKIYNVAANVETLDEETQLIIAQLNEILVGGRNTDGISFKKVDMSTLNRTTAKVNRRVIELIETKNITQTNNFYQSCRCLGSRSVRSEKV